MVQNRQQTAKSNLKLNPRKRIGKLDFVDGSRADVLKSLYASVEARRGKTESACFCEAHLFVRAHREADVYHALSRFDRIYPDGTSILLGALLMGKRLHQRHPGPQILLEICDTGRTNGLKHYFYGGRAGVGERLSAHLEKKFPGIQIVGHESPPFRPLTELEEEEACERINASGADVLWVGLGAPKQELWIQRNKYRLKVPLAMAVGAAFEYFSGDQKWAPAWMRRYGLEWLYRMTTGGPRLFKRYAKYVPLCCYVMVKEAIVQRLKRRSAELTDPDSRTLPHKP